MAGNNQEIGANAIPVWLAPAPSGQGPSAVNMPANASTLLKTGAGTFAGISVNAAGVGSTVKIYDGLTAGGTLLGTFNTAVLGPNFPGPGWPFATGLFAVTAGGTPADVTISFY